MKFVTHYIYKRKVIEYGKDILRSDNMKRERYFIQHGKTSVLKHCFNVACISLFIANKLNLEISEREIVRGALLHDYFMYDWHEKTEEKRRHGFTHARRALLNAKRDFIVSSVEEDIIVKHMFPLNIAFPKYRESVIVCIADKICAVCETFGIFTVSEK